MKLEVIFNQLFDITDNEEDDPLAHLTDDLNLLVNTTGNYIVQIEDYYDMDATLFSIEEFQQKYEGFKSDEGLNLGGHVFSEFSLTLYKVIIQ